MKMIFKFASALALASSFLISTTYANPGADPGTPLAPRPGVRPELVLSGYAELHAGLYAYGANQNRAGGSQRDVRLELDTTRLVLALEAELPSGLALEAEVEFEHGGTGAALELEYEEFGEFDSEVEKGGEVIVEELYLRKRIGDRYAVSVDRFDVAVGQLSRYYRPKPDLVPACPQASPDEVAPCGYVQAPVVIADIASPARGALR